MKTFAGFPAKSHFTPLPNLFFSTLLPQIEDMAELKATLHIFWVLYQKRGYPRFVTYKELLADKSLMEGIGEGSSSARLSSPKSPAACVELRRDELLRHGLELATQRGTILHLSLVREGELEELYFLNTEADRKAVAKIKSGEISLGALPKSEPCTVTERPNVFALYEQNIGMLTPLIADELREAEELYPASWIEDAFKQAVVNNKRSWRYVARILERWASEGKDSGEPGRHSKEIDPDKYIKGRYGHLVKRRL